MHLRSATKRQATPSRAPPRLAPAPPPYISPYNHGIATNAEGEFDHFIRLFDDSRLQKNGYWKFDSNADERRAYDRGFYSPEAILIAHDQRKGSFDDIKLRWMPGEAEIHIYKSLDGSVVQHLKTIYEVRRVLDLPMTLQGVTPVYPVSKDINLKEFWDRKRAESLPIPLAESEAPNSGSTNDRTEISPRPTVSPLSSPVAESIAVGEPSVSKKTSPIPNTLSRSSVIENSEVRQSPYSSPISSGDSYLGMRTFGKSQVNKPPQSNDQHDVSPAQVSAVSNQYVSPYSPSSLKVESSSQQDVSMSPMPDNLPQEPGSTLHSKFVNKVPELQPESVATSLEERLILRDENVEQFDSSPQYDNDADDVIQIDETEPIPESTLISFGLPCMDCGLEIDHKSSCHIGSKLGCILSLKSC